MTKLAKPQMRPKVKIDPSLSEKSSKISIGWSKLKATVGLLALTAGFMRAVYLEADNRVYVLGAGVLLSVLLLSSILEVMYKKG